MKVSEIEKRLKAWADRCEAVDKVYEDMRRLVGVDSEGPLASQLFGVLENYTEAVGEIVGDRAGWLDWFRHECNMGRKPMGAQFEGERKERKVKTVGDLARVIAGDRAGWSK